VDPLETTDGKPGRSANGRDDRANPPHEGAMKKRCWIPSNSALGPGTLCLDCLLVLHLQIRFAVHQNWNED
jgi:hypothetical protein